MYLGTSAGTLRWIIVSESDVLKSATRSARPTRFPWRGTINLQNTSLQPCNHKIDFFTGCLARPLDPVRAASIPRSLGKQIALLCLFNSTQEKSTLFIIDKSDLHNKIISYRCTCCHHFQFHSTKKRYCWFWNSLNLRLLPQGTEGWLLWIINLVAPPSTANHQSTNNRFYSGMDLTSQQCIIILPNHES